MEKYKKLVLWVKFQSMTSLRGWKMTPYFDDIESNYDKMWFRTRLFLVHFTAWTPKSKSKSLYAYSVQIPKFLSEKNWPVRQLPHGLDFFLEKNSDINAETFPQNWSIMEKDLLLGRTFSGRRLFVSLGWKQHELLLRRRQFREAKLH